MKMKRFFLFLVLVSATVVGAFAQNMVSSEELICLSARFDGKQIAPYVRSANINYYADGRHQLCIYYRDSSPTDYIYFRNGREFGDYMTYDVTIGDTKTVAEVRRRRVGYTEQLEIEFYNGKLLTGSFLFQVK